MAQKRDKFRFPTKGVIKALSFEDHPLEAMTDALNIRLFDRDGRMRLCQRPGVSKLYAGVIGAGMVRAMRQVTLGSALTSGRSMGSPVTNGAVAFSDPYTTAPGIWLGNDAAKGSTWVGINASGLATLLEPPVAPPPTANLVSDAAGAWCTLTGTTAKFVPDWVLPSQHPAFINMISGDWMGTPPGPDYVVAIDVNMDTIGANGVYALADRHDSVNRTTAGAVDLMVTTTTWTVHCHATNETFSGVFSPALTGWVEIKIATISDDGTEAAATRFHHFYVDGVRLTGWQGASTPGAYGDIAGIISVIYAAPSSTTPGAYAEFDNLLITNLTVSDTITGIGRDTRIVYVVGEDVALGDTASATTSTAGSGVIDSTAQTISVATCSTKAYVVDGTVTKVLDLATNVLANLTATVGAYLAKCRLTCLWRDRLVLAAPDGDEQNYILSRVGTHTDFDTSQKDSAAAFAGNASTAGRIGDVIIGLMPFSDDVLLFPCDHSIWAMNGDPADGGSIDFKAALSVLGPDAWCLDPKGVAYFASTSGLYRMAPQGIPECITNDKWTEFFSGINRATSFVSMVWDQDGQGCHIFVTPLLSSVATHLWWDARLECLVPDQFPNDFGPASALVYDGDGPTDRRLLLGCRDGYVRRVVHNVKTDDGTAISSYAILGPYSSGDELESVLDWLTPILSLPVGSDATADTNLTIQVFAGQTAEEAYADPVYTRSRTYTTPGRQARWMNRTRGAAFFIKLSNAVSGKTWGLETMGLGFSQGGLVRRR